MIKLGQEHPYYFPVFSSIPVAFTVCLCSFCDIFDLLSQSVRQSELDSPLSVSVIDLLTRKPISLLLLGAGVLLAPPAVSASPPGCPSGLLSLSTSPLL